MAFNTVVSIASIVSSNLIISSSLPTSVPSSSKATLIKLNPHVCPSTLIPSASSPASSSSSSSSSSSALTSILLPSAPSSYQHLLSPALLSSTSPIVVHLGLNADADLTPLLGLRSSGWVILKSDSSDPVPVGDSVLVASKLAKDANKLVLHVYPVGTESTSSTTEEGIVYDHFSIEQVQEFFQSAPVQLSASTSTNEEAEFKAYETAALATLKFTRRPQRAYVTSSPKDESEVSVAAVLFGFGESENLVPALKDAGIATIQINLLRPVNSAKLASLIPKGVKKIVVLEQSYTRSTKWGAVFMDVLSSLPEIPELVDGILGQVTDAKAAAQQVLEASGSFTLGSIPSTDPNSTLTVPHVPAHETSYTTILDQTFLDRLEIVNSPDLVPAVGELATRPEYAFGKVSALLEQREQLVEVLKQILRDESTSGDLHDAAARWLVLRDDKDTKKADEAGRILITALEKVVAEGDDKRGFAAQALNHKESLRSVSRWIIGSDAWSYDLGSSGIHHAIASGKNVNMLIIDTEPYTTRGNNKRKKDIGLYAMNHGDVYVASVAVYSSYSQVLQALIAADAYPGPSIVLAYLPYGTNESASALDVLKETKLAVDNAYWPLYRWDPSNESFMLDSVRIKEAIKEFLDRQNHLSLLTAAHPSISSEITSSVGTDLVDKRKAKAREAYEKMVNSLDGPPLLILYASDGGNAEKQARKLANRAKTRGLATRMIAMDSFPFDDLKLEEHVVFLTSTAGQGEAPQNGRETYKSLLKATPSEDWAKINFSVFAMGDSHYWPRPEDAHYYNKPGKDIDTQLEKLGATRMAPIGLGNDQDPDGAQTGYKIWEPLLWKAMGVDGVEVLEAEPEPITNENIKIASNYLRGTILEGLDDETTGAIDPSDAQLTKFHGTYMQDDRDIRDERKEQGLEPAYSFMIRCRMPGGVCKPEQWLAIDQISDEHGNSTFKLTTRQTFQFHGIIKKHLKPAMQAINRTLLDTIAACGDVNRNVQLSVNPSYSKLHDQVYKFSVALSEHLLPSTTAYHEIWLDKKLVAGEAVKDFEPLYGPYYLPRKFKIAVAVPPDNSVDVFTNDVGFIAITDEAGELAGFNVTVGGGMGVTHSNKKTYPRLGDVIGFVTPEEGTLVAEKIMLTQRDNGNRADRKNARLKYTVDRMGLKAFVEDVEARLGHALAPARPFKFDQNIDNFGWVKGANGKWHFTMFIENGRVEDNAHHQFKSGLREIASVHKGDFRLTANQHCILSDVAEEDLPEMKRLLAKWKLDKIDHSALRQSSSACVAFPTCGLAMAESERYLPLLVDKLEVICEEAGLRNDSIVMRMTGCPNGCARPWAAEVAFVGKAPGTYLMMLGGGYYGQRLNKPFKESVTEKEILEIMRPMIKRYALEREEGERFGDWTIRAGYVKPTLSGKSFYDDSVLA